MSLSPVNIAVVDNKTIVKAEALSAAKNGAPVKIKAVSGAKYILAEGENGVAPENVTIKRVGKDLHVILEGSDVDSPQLIIEDFYTNPGELVGKGEDGNWHEYVSTDGDQNHEAPFLLDGDTTAYALGAESIAPLDGLAVASGINPWLVGLGALAALAAAGLLIAALSKDDGKATPFTDGGEGGGGGGGSLVPTPIVSSVTDTKGAVTGTLTDGQPTDDAQPTFTGTGTPGNDVELRDDLGNVIGTGTVGSDGNWSITPTAPLPEGPTNIVVVEKDAEGNESAPTPPFVVNVDTTPPEMADLESVVDDTAPKTGLIGIGDSTNDTQPTFNGKAEPNATVDIILDGVKVDEVVVNAEGNWTWTPSTPMAEGAHDVVLVVRDEAGNVSDPTPPFNFIVDTTAPDKPAGNNFMGAWDDVGVHQGWIEPNSTTDDTQPDFQGSGLEAGHVVLIKDNISNQIIGSTTVNADGTWKWTPPDDAPLTNGPQSISIIDTDLAGNQSAPSDPLDFIIDVRPPAAPIITQVIDNQGAETGDIFGQVNPTTDDNRPQFIGTAEPGALVYFYDNGSTTPIGSALADATGAWSFIPVDALLNGSHSIVAQAQDAAGNNGGASNRFDFVVDVGGIAPAIAITGIYDGVEGVTGLIQPGTETNDARPRIEGTSGAPNGTVITISDESGVLGTTIVTNGRWTFVPTTDLADGNHTITAEAATGGPKSEWPIVIDTTPPGDLTDISLWDDAGAVTGAISTGSETDDTTPVYSGKGEAGDTIIIKDNGVAIGTATVDASGEWQFIPTTPLDDGDHSFTATPVDPAGNTGPTSPAIDFKVDTSTVVVSIDYAADNVDPITGNLANGAATDDTTPTLHGKATPNAVVTILVDGVAVGSAQADGFGNWSHEVTLAEGTHNITASVTNAAGTTTTNNFELIVDTTAPTGTFDSVTDDVGIIQGELANPGATDDTTPTLHGTGTAGDSVNIYVDGEKVGTTIVKADGSWDYTLTQQNEGTIAVEVSFSDPVGNESAKSDIWPITIDTTAPVRPEGDAMKEALDDVGSIQGPIAEGSRTDDNRPEFNGQSTSLNPGEIVHIYDGADEIGTAVVQPDGSWSFEPEVGDEMSDGPHTITIRVEDAVGNLSDPSDPYHFTVDTQGPGTPGTGPGGALEGAYDDVPAVVGWIPQDGITNDNRPTFSGSGLEPGDSVSLRDDGVEFGTAIVDANGNWSFTPEVGDEMAEGPHTVTIVVTDPVGNPPSAESDPLNFTIDVTAPNAPIITQVIDDQGAVTGPITSGDKTDDDMPEIRGTAEPGSLVNVYDGPNLVGSALADATTGVWVVTPTMPLGQGDHTLTAVATDPAGNTGRPSNEFDLTVETGGIPTAIAITGVYDNVEGNTGLIQQGELTNDPRPVISGTSSAPNGSIVTITDGTNVIGSATVTDGRWSVTPTADLSEAAHDLVANVTVGGVTDVSAPWGIVVDTTPPADLTDPTLTDDVGAITGPILDGGTTDDSTPTFSGEGEPGDTVVIKDNGEIIGTTVVKDDGSWEFTPETPLEDGDHSLTATPVDPAGNEGTPTAPIDFEVDTSAVVVSIDYAVDNVDKLTGNLATGAVTNDTTPTLHGKATIGAIVTIMQGTTVLGSAVADSQGNWSAEITLTEGAHTVTAQVTNAGGTVISNDFDLVIDTTAPTGTFDGVTDDVGSVTGELANPGKTDDTTPTLHGTGTTGDIVNIYKDGVLQGTTIVKADGTWDFTLAPQNDGDYKLEVSFEDNAGNESAKDAWDITVDTSAPDRPIVGPGGALEGAFDDVPAVVGWIPQDGVTNDDRPTFSGSGLNPGETVHLRDDGVEFGTAIVKPDGTWEFTPEVGEEMAEGPHTVTIVVSTPTGANSPESDPLNFTIDVTAPNAPIITQVIDDQGAVTGPITSGDKTDDDMPEIRGTAEPGSLVNVYDGPNLVGSALADATTGVWVVTPTMPLGQGDHTLTAVATDPAGNTGRPSNEFDLTVETGGIPTAIAITGVYDNVEGNTGLIQQGELTNDPRPVISGTSSAPNGSIVTITDGTNVIGSATVTDGRWSVTPTADLSEAAHDLVANVTVGGVTDVSAPWGIVVDTTPPADLTDPTLTDDVGAITGPILDGGTTDDSTPTFSGEGEPGDTVVIKDNGEIIGTTVVKDDGSWEFTPETPLEDGDHSLTATPVDPAGNEGTPTAPIDFEVDTSAVVVSIDYAVDNVDKLTGNLATGAVTNDTTPTLHGKATIGAIVTIMQGTTVLGSAVADSQGNWSAEITLTEGAHTVTAQVTNAGGTVTSNAFDLVIDTTAPTGTFDGVTDDVGSVTGELANPGKTDDTTPTLHGTGTTGDIVNIYKDGVLQGTTIVKADGTWDFTLAPQNDGDYKLEVSFEDNAGNESAKDAWDITVDTSAPDRPIVGPGGALEGAFDDVPAVTGWIEDNGLTNDNRPTFSGSGLNPGETVHLRDDGVEFGTAIVKPDGTWEFTPEVGDEMAEGDHAVSIIITTPVGTSSPESDPLNFTVDSEAPNPPVITQVIDDQGAVTGPIASGDKTDDEHPDIKGTAEPGSTVLVYDGPNLVGSAIADATTGEWTVTPTSPLGQGDHTLTAVAVDPAGNTGNPSAGFDLTVETGAIPSSVAITGVYDAVEGNTGLIQPEGLTNDPRPKIVGTAGVPDGTVVTISTQNGVLGTATVTGGRWEFNPVNNLPEGNNTITAVATVDGVASAPSSWPVMVDTVAPADLTDPTLTDDVGAITGPILDGGTTDDSTPTFSGEGEPGDTVVIKDNGEIIGTTVVKDDGSWEFTPETPLEDGDHSLTATPVDPAGNEGTPTAPIDFEVDTSAVVVSIDYAVDNVDKYTGNLASGAVTNDTTPTLHGKATIGAIITIMQGTTVLGSAVADSLGNWSAEITLAEGAHTVTAQVTNAGGTVTSNDFDLVIDTTAPTGTFDDVIDDVGSVTGAIANPGTTDDTTPTLKGTGTAGDTVTVFKDGVPQGTTTVKADGSWEFTLAPQEEGTYQLTASFTDPAGNESAQTPEHEITVDTTPPALGSIEGVTDDYSGTPQEIANGGRTNDDTPAVHGRGEAGAKVALWNGSVLLGTTTVALDGTWSVQLGTQRDDTYNYTATFSDEQGNTTERTPQYQVTIDTTPPAVGTIVSVIDNGSGTDVVISSGGSTNDNTPTVSGTGREEGAIVKIWNGPTLLGTAVVAGGVWTVELPDQVDGTYNLTASFVDDLGNESGHTAPPYSIIIDTAAPDKPTISDAYDNVGADQGWKTSGTTIDDSTPQLRGTAPGGAHHVEIWEGTTLLGTAAVAGDGSWLYTTPTRAVGSHTFTVKAVDAANNVSDVSDDFTLNIVAPAPVTVVTSHSENFESWSGMSYLAKNTGYSFASGLTVKTLSQTGTGEALYGLPSIAPGNTWSAENSTNRTEFLFVKNQSQVELSFDKGANAISYDLADLNVIDGADRPKVSYYDTSGVLIETRNLPRADGRIANVSYTPPAGRLIGKIVFTGATKDSDQKWDSVQWAYIVDAGFTIDNLSWTTTDVSRSMSMSADIPLVDDSLVAASTVEDSIDKSVSASTLESNEQNNVLNEAEPDAKEKSSDDASKVTYGLIFDTEQHQFVVTDAEQLENGSIELKGTKGVIDTLVLEGEHQVLDLSKLGDRLTSMEVIDMTGSGDNTLKVSLGDVLAQGDKDLFINDGKVQMMVKGNEGDVVNLSDLLPDGSDAGDWNTGGNVTVSGVEYTVYEHSGQAAEILIQQGINTNLDNH